MEVDEIVVLYVCFECSDDIFVILVIIGEGID